MRDKIWAGVWNISIQLQVVLFTWSFLLDLLSKSFNFQIFRFPNQCKTLFAKARPWSPVKISNKTLLNSTFSNTSFNKFLIWYCEFISSQILINSAAIFPWFLISSQPSCLGSAKQSTLKKIKFPCPIVLVCGDSNFVKFLDQLQKISKTKLSTEKQNSQLGNPGFRVNTLITKSFLIFLAKWTLQDPVDKKYPLIGRLRRTRRYSDRHTSFASFYMMSLRKPCSKIEYRKFEKRTLLFVISQSRLRKPTVLSSDWLLRAPWTGDREDVFLSDLRNTEDCMTRDGASNVLLVSLHGIFNTKKQAASCTLFSVINPNSIAINRFWKTIFLPLY